MQTATTIALMLVRVTGLINIVLGVLFWTGHALTLIPVHTQLGFVLVLSLWALAVLAAWAGVSPALVALAFVWGLLVPVVGMTQYRLLVGDAHWVIRVLHLLISLGAMGLAEGLTARIKSARAPALQR